MPTGPIAGLPAALREVLASALDIGRVRLLLARNELEEARLRLLETFVYGLLASLLLVIGLVLAAVAVAVIYWDTHRLQALVAESLFFIGAAVVLGLRLRARAQAAPALLGTTLAELQRDAQALRALDPSTTRQ